MVIRRLKKQGTPENQGVRLGIKECDLDGAFQVENKGQDQKCRSRVTIKSKEALCIFSIQGTVGNQRTWGGLHTGNEVGKEAA